MVLRRNLSRAPRQTSDKGSELHEGASGILQNTCYASLLPSSQGMHACVCACIGLPKFLSHQNCNLSTSNKDATFGWPNPSISLTECYKKEMFVAAQHRVYCSCSSEQIFALQTLPSPLTHLDICHSF